MSKVKRVGRWCLAALAGAGIGLLGGLAPLVALGLQDGNLRHFMRTGAAPMLLVAAVPTAITALCGYAGGTRRIWPVAVPVALVAAAGFILSSGGDPKGVNILALSGIVAAAAWLAGRAGQAMAAVRMNESRDGSGRLRIQLLPLARAKQFETFAWLLGNLSGEAPVASGEDAEGCHRSFRVRRAVVVLRMDRHSEITVCTEDGTEEELLRDTAEHLLRRAGV